MSGGGVASRPMGALVTSGVAASPTPELSRQYTPRVGLARTQSRVIIFSVIFYQVLTVTTYRHFRTTGT